MKEKQNIQSHNTFSRCKNNLKRIRTVRYLIEKPEIFFLVFSAFFGIIFVFLNPPMQVYDERTHFLQAYAVSKLDVVPHKFEYQGRYHYGAELPRSVFQASAVFIAGTAGHADVRFNESLIRQYVRQPLRPGVTDHQESGTEYSPVVYIPQAIGIAIGRIFAASPLILIWLGRLMNLCAWLIIVYFAIKMLPFGKWVMVVLALNPMALFLAASLSADVMTTALAFLFFSLIASACTSRIALTNTRIGSLVAVVGLMALTKPTNILFALLLFAVPWKNFKTVRRYALICIGALIFGIVLAGFWNHAVSAASEFTAQTQSAGKLINPSAQLSGTIHHPLHYIKTILYNYVFVPGGYPGDFTLVSIVGVLGWGETSIPLWTVVLYVICFTLALLYVAGRGPIMTRVQKAILAVTFGLFVLGNITAMYLYSTGLGQMVITGVQGRYFIPGLILFAGLFTARKKILDISQRQFALTAGIILLVVLSMTTLKIFVRYYFG